MTKVVYSQMDVSKNNGTPKSSILIGFSIVNHPFWGTIIFGNTQIALKSMTSFLHLVRSVPSAESPGFSLRTAKIIPKSGIKASTLMEELNRST